MHKPNKSEWISISSLKYHWSWKQTPRVSNYILHIQLYRGGSRGEGCNTLTGGRSEWRSFCMIFAFFWDSEEKLYVLLTKPCGSAQRMSGIMECIQYTAWQRDGWCHSHPPPMSPPRISGSTPDCTASTQGSFGPPKLPYCPCCINAAHMITLYLWHWHTQCEHWEASVVSQPLSFLSLSASMIQQDINSSLDDTRQKWSSYSGVKEISHHHIKLLHFNYVAGNMYKIICLLQWVALPVTSGAVYYTDTK